MAAQTFPYYGFGRPFQYRAPDRYAPVKQTATKVWKLMRDVAEAVTPTAVCHIKNLKPPVTAFFSALANKVVKNEKKPDAPAPAASAPGAGKGAKIGGVAGPVIRAISKAIGAAFQKAARSIAGGLSDDDDDGYAYYRYLCCTRMAGYQPPQPK